MKVKRKVFKQHQCHDKISWSKNWSSCGKPDGRKDIYYYHLITGHMSIRALTRLQEQGKIKCSVDDQDAKQKIKGCKQCILVNAKQHSHNKTTQAPPERSLYRFHCDTMGPTTLVMLSFI